MKRAYDIVNQLVDIIGYIDITWDDEGNSTRYLYTRKTPTIMAGSRFKYLAPKIPFGYKELVDAIADALDKSQKLDGITVIDGPVEVPQEKPSRSYEEVRAEALALWTTLVEKDEANAARVLKKVEMIFGRKMKLSEITEDQVDLYELVVAEMKTL